MTNVAEQDIKTINGWVERVDTRLDKLTEAVEQLRLGQLRFEMLLTQISDGQKQYLTPTSLGHTKVLKDIQEMDDRLRDLQRTSLERQRVIDKAETYMKRLDEMDKSLSRVWRTITWIAAAAGTIGIALVIKWLETIIVRPNLYKAAMLSLWGG